MEVRLWGVRGSLATPMSTAQLRAKVNALLAEATPADLADQDAINRYLDRTPHSWTYGGNTSCVEVSFGDQLFVLDSGTGLRSLGQEILKDGRAGKVGINMFFTHFHWDHICGFPYFAPIYFKDRRIDVWGGRSDAEELLATQMGGAHFPVKWANLPSRIKCHQLPEDRPTTIAGAEVRILPLIHPDKAFGYRITYRGRSVCYLTDTEVSKNPHRLNDVYARFVDGADVVIVDAMYGFLDYHEKVNFGHSTIFNFIDFFRETTIGELVIFHHDPLASDPSVTALWDDAKRYKSVIAPDATWKLTAAFEGQHWSLAETGPVPAVATEVFAPPAPPAPAAAPAPAKRTVAKPRPLRGKPAVKPAKPRPAPRARGAPPKARPVAKARPAPKARPVAKARPMPKARPAPKARPVAKARKPAKGRKGR
jgi:phosphoribosyl 1,2-cyclic phosphodiesterase